jgi:hypothetical protein
MKINLPSPFRPGGKWIKRGQKRKKRVKKQEKRLGDREIKGLGD